MLRRSGVTPVPELAGQIFDAWPAGFDSAGDLDDAQIALGAGLERGLMDGLQERPYLLGRTFDHRAQAVHFVA